MCKANAEVADGHLLVLRELCIYYIIRILLLKKQLSLCFFYDKKKKTWRGRHSTSVTYLKIMLVGINNREIRKEKTNMGKV